MTARTVALLLASTLLLPSCSDMDEYFETPSWIQGSIYEKMQSEGNYSQFLKGVEKIGYTPILNGKAILTVMAPDDNAMKTYLQDTYQVQDITDLSVDEIKKLIGFHMLYYSYDKDKLINFRPSEGDGATTEELSKKAGLYYKFRTRSQDAVEKTQREVVTDNGDGTTTTTYEDIYVYHPDRFIPVFSYMMFRTKGIDAEQNYSYFYPETGWNGDGGFQVANANVTQYAGVGANNEHYGIANNGYIYKIDRVLRPLETIYTELTKSDKYSRFVSYYDQYKTYTKSDDLTSDFATDEQQTTGLWTMSFGSLPAIANEWPIDDYKQMTTLSHRTYSIFAPTDQAIENFFEEYWKVGGYESLDDVPSNQMIQLLTHSIFQETSSNKDQSMIFPQEIEEGKIQDSEGNTIRFDTEEVPQEDRIICSNGVLYGCSVLTPPAAFNSVTGPAYQYKKYSTFGTMISSTAANGASMDKTLSMENISYIMLYPDNDQLENSDLHITVSKTSPATIMKQELTDETPVALGSSIVANYVNAHAVQAFDNVTELPLTNSQPAVFATMQSAPMKVYWYVKNGKITNSIQYLKSLKYAANTATEADIWAAFTPLDYRGDVDGWTNGHAYTYDDLLFPGNYNSTTETLAFYALITNQNTDKTSDFYGWYNLLSEARVLSGGNLASTFVAENCLTFVPKTSAITKAIVEGRIPGITVDAGTAADDANFFDKVTVTDQQALRYYLVRYFVPLSTAVISNYPYLGWGETTTGLENGGLETVQIMDNSGDTPTVGKSYVLNVYDNGSALSVKTKDLQTGVESQQVNVIPDYDYLPLIFSDGVFHFIADVL